MDTKEEYKKLLEIVKKQLKGSGMQSRNEDVAEILGYNRTYFSTLIGKEGNITKGHIKELKLHFPFLLENQTNSDLDGVNRGNKLVRVKQIKEPLEDTIGRFTEQIINMRAHIEVFESAIAGLLCKDPDDKLEFTKRVGELRKEIKKTANRLFDELDI